MEAQTAFDPVSRRAVTPGGTGISAVYQGRAYCFESRENRDAFESNLEKYLVGSSVAGLRRDQGLWSYMKAWAMKVAKSGGELWTKPKSEKSIAMWVSRRSEPELIHLNAGFQNLSR